MEVIEKVKIILLIILVTPLPSEIKKALALNEIPEENGVVKLNLRLQAIKSEEKAILDKAGVCEKCGRPFRIGKGRWGR